MRRWLPVFEVDVDAIYRNRAARQKRAAGKGGRLPYYDAAMVYTNVMLDTKSLEKARQLGGGNVSKGVRLALGAPK